MAVAPSKSNLGQNAFAKTKPKNFEPKTDQALDKKEDTKPQIKPPPAGNKKFKVKTDMWSLFTGFYSLLTYPGIISNQIENFVTMTLKPIINAKSVDDASLPENSKAKEYTKVALSKPSIFKSLLAVPAKLLGFNKENDRDFDGLITFYARFLQRISTPFFNALGLTVPFNKPGDGDLKAAKSDFNFIKHRNLNLGEDGEPIDPKGHIRQWTEQVNPDPSENAKREGLGGFWYNLNHPTTSRNALSFIFNVKNAISVMQAKTPENLGLLGKSLNALKMMSSVVSSVFAPAGSMLAWLFAFNGKKLLITASSLWALIGAIHLPGNHALELATNLLSAIGTKKKTGRSLKSILKDMDMLNIGKLFHGTVGGVLAVPSVFGYFARMFQTYKDTRYIFVPSAREFGRIIHKLMNKVGLAKTFTEDKFADDAAALVKASARISRDYLVPAVDRLINFAPIRIVLKTVLPVVTDPVTGKERIPLDVYKNIFTDITMSDNAKYVAADLADKDKYKNFMGAPTVDAEARDLSKEHSKKNTLFGFLPKSESMMYLFKVFSIFETWSLSIAYAFEDWLDKDIQENAIAPLRYFDKLIGTVNTALALPNAILYGVGARVPQMVASYYDIKQRIADSYDWKSTDGENLDVMKDNLKPLTKKLLNSSLPFMRYLGKVFNEDLIHNVYGDSVFKDPHKANMLITDFFEKLSFKQEYSIEAPAAMQYLRNVIKWSMNHFDSLHRKNPQLN